MLDPVVKATEIRSYTQHGFQKQVHVALRHASGEISTLWMNVGDYIDYIETPLGTNQVSYFDPSKYDMPYR